MGNIFNISNWSAEITYSKFDIVKYDNNFFYSLQEENLNRTPVVGSSYWGGLINVTTVGVTKALPYFFWAPSYGVQMDNEPKILSIKFGNGYEQRSADGTNHNLLSLNLNFEHRSEKESESIVHFLSSREGYKSFYFKSPSPYNVVKKFVCKSWSSQLEFDNNVSVSVKFEEVV